jgi:hypothetical protein
MVEETAQQSCFFLFQGRESGQGFPQNKRL